MDSAFDEGMEQGIKRGIEQTARSSLKMGLSVEEAAKGSGLTVEDVEKMKEWKIET